MKISKSRSSHSSNQKREPKKCLAACGVQHATLINLQDSSLLAISPRMANTQDNFLWAKMGWLHHPLSQALVHLRAIWSHPSLGNPPVCVALWSESTSVSRVLSTPVNCQGGLLTLSYQQLFVGIVDP